MLVGVLMGAASLIIAHLLASCSSHDEQAEAPTSPTIQPQSYQGITLHITCTDYQKGSRVDGSTRWADSSTKGADSSTKGADGSVKGIEGIPSGSIQIICFDSNHRFAGMAEDVSNTQSGNDGDTQSNTDGKTQTVRATIPSNSTTLHILANAHITAEDSWQGKSEHEIMGMLEGKYDTHEHLIYWGCIRQESTQQMITFLENPDNTISMMRDRAKVTCNILDTNISEARIALCNAFASGTMIDCNAINSQQQSSNVSMEASGIVNIPSAPSLRIDNTERDFAPTTFTFEHPNRPGDYLRAIIRVIYKDGSIRYHHICLENDLHEPYAILRNHEYRINIIKLSENTGYDSFEGAKNGDASNNAFVTVDDIVPEVSDGTHSMLINAGTSVVYNAGAEPQQTIHFTYTGDATITASSFKAEWIENQDLAAASSPTIIYDANMGKGEIHFQLQSISSQLKSAKLHLLDTRHGLSRVIHLYSITQFELKTTFQSKLGDNRLGKNKGDEGELTVDIPLNYPEDLLPINLKIASNDINPKDLSVEVSSTDDVDGSKEDASIKPWNCWFVYKAHTPGSQAITIKNVRAASAGSQGKFYVKADYFGKPLEISFVYQ